MSKQKPITRPATIMDSVNIVRLIRAGWEESPATVVAPMNEQKLMEYVTTNLKHCFCVVVELDGRILGSICLVPIRLPWAENAVALAEGWFGVHPSQRRRGIPELLLGAADRFLDLNKHVAIMGSNILAAPELNETMAQRPGYVPARQTFLRVPVEAAA